MENSRLFKISLLKNAKKNKVHVEISFKNGLELLFQAMLVDSVDEQGNIIFSRKDDHGFEYCSVDDIVSIRSEEKIH